MSARAVRVSAIAALLTTPVLLLLVAGCRQTPALPELPSSRLEVADREFVGNAACAECHSAECKLYENTHHATTLHSAGVAALGPLAPGAGPIEKSPFAIRRDGDRLVFLRKDSPQSGAGIQYAFGSGKYVITYAADFGPGRLTELSMSYHPGQRKWYITPGQERQSGLNLGVVDELGRARKCVLCHAVKTKRDSAEPEPGFLGVGCESCHGSGRAHIDAIRSGAHDIKMDKMGTWGAARVDAVCARCHRSAGDLSPTALEVNSTARFQVVGLEMSPCFKKSGDRLSCLTCHNPHTNSHSNPKIYERVCLSCHSAATRDSKVCPVNPKDKCIGCHMPKEPVFAAAGIPISMADHLIWANRPQKPATTAGTNGRSDRLAGEPAIAAGAEHGG